MILEIGIYVRTENGMIGKITHFNKKEIEFDGLLYYCDYENCSDKYCYYETPEELNFITKLSLNLIDLIEVGDFVNGHLVYEIEEHSDGYDKELHLESCEVGSYRIDRYDAKDYIKSILTHEQYETNSYKKGE
jgi:hypothetical protein